VNREEETVFAAKKKKKKKKKKNRKKKRERKTLRPSTKNRAGANEKKGKRSRIVRDQEEMFFRTGRSEETGGARNLFLRFASSPGKHITVCTKMQEGGKKAHQNNN